MPHYTAETPTIERKFIDHTFRVPSVFTDGHTLTPNETKWLNSQVASVVANAFSGDVRRAVSALTVNRIEAAITGEAKQKAAVAAFTKSGKVPEGVIAATVSDLGWDLDAKFAEKFEDYELGVSNRGSGLSTASPIDSLMRSLATAKVKHILTSRGLKVKEYMDAKEADGTTSVFSGMVRDYIIRFSDDLRANAEAQLADAAGEDELEVPTIAA